MDPLFFRLTVLVFLCALFCLVVSFSSSIHFLLTTTLDDLSARGDAACVH